MTDPRTHYQDLANAVAAAIVAIGEIILASREDAPSKPSNVPNQTPNQTPVVHETPVPATEEKGGRITSRQLGMLRKLCNEKLDGDWNAFEATCKSRFGRATSYLSSKEASTLISELIGGHNGNHSRTAAR